LVAYPVINVSKLCKIMNTAIDANAAGNFSMLTLMVDSLHGVKMIGQAVVLTHTQRLLPPGALKLNIMVKIDVGLHRCGINPFFSSVGSDGSTIVVPDTVTAIPLLLSVVHAITQHHQLNFAGIMSHGGMAYGATTPAECTAMADSELNVMRATKALLESNGTHVPLLSVGCTLTELARTDFKDIDEIRPGNYVFNDATPLRLQLIGRAAVALTVLATVISVNPEYSLIDAGSKVMSSDKGAHGTTGGVYGYGQVRKVAPSVRNPFSYPASRAEIPSSNCELSRAR
jgi:D-serine deaminase-like pyridoxal phosphate-dependent protein